MANTSCVRETLERLRSLKVSLAIDDFGTGFSSFSYIMEYHVDRLKIDRSFVSRLQQDETGGAVVRAIIAMAHSLNIELVAEGVETRAQLEFLARKRCETVQGFLFSRAVPIAEFAEVVARIESQEPEQRRMDAAEASDPGKRPPLPVARLMRSTAATLSAGLPH